jgi:hypothetical protein
MVYPTVICVVHQNQSVRHVHKEKGSLICRLSKRRLVLMNQTHTREFIEVFKL